VRGGTGPGTRPRYRILVQNQFLGVPEEKFLRTLQLEEKLGEGTYQVLTLHSAVRCSGSRSLADCRLAECHCQGKGTG
jgi:hypothetical protein